jgi:hypothetical protein
VKSLLSPESGCGNSDHCGLADVLRRAGRCTVCGHKGATLRHPTWKNHNVGVVPFPVDRMT